METRIVRVLERDLSPSQHEAIRRLQQVCFGGLAAADPTVDEDFIADSFGRVFAYARTDDTIGMLRLFKRHIDYAGEEIVLGGAGGVCVAEHMRRRGVATQMLREALSALRQEGCDIACLNVDLSKQAYRVYEKLGFRLMQRPISFENSRGDIKHDTGTMFVPVCSQVVYNRVMNSTQTFHYGKGYW